MLIWRPLVEAYSNDLRERVAAACAAPGATHTAVAARFYVSVSFVEKLRQRANGLMAARTRRARGHDGAGRAGVELAAKKRASTPPSATPIA